MAAMRSARYGTSGSSSTVSPALNMIPLMVVVGLLVVTVRGLK